VFGLYKVVAGQYSQVDTFSDTFLAGLFSVI